MVMHRKGQVFLMAAIIIAGLLFALTKNVNKGFARDEPEAFYDLSEEIGFETKRVLDYGVINGQPQVTTALQAGQLLGSYAEYVAREDVVFIYGDLTNVFAVYYDSTQALGIQLLNNTFISINILTQTPVEVQKDSTAGTATVRIRGNDYTFKLKTGQNFYFVLIKEDENEQFVALE